MVVMKTIFEQLTLDSTLAEGDLVLPSSWERPGTAGLPSDGWKAGAAVWLGSGSAAVAVTAVWYAWATSSATF